MRAHLLFVLLLSLGQFQSTCSAEEELDHVLFDPSRPELRTDAALVMVEGRIVYERYSNGYGPTSKHLSWSVAKSTAGILIGIAADQGYLSLNDPVKKWIPEYKDSGTVLDFLRMSSNLKFLEEYAGIPITADVVKMLYLDGPKVGFATYVSHLPLRTGTLPGDHYYYSSGDTNVLMEVLKRAVGNRYDSFPWVEYFNKIGIEDATLEQDSQGTFVGSSYLYLSARNFAKIGNMIGNGGFVNGSRVIPKSYFDLMNTVAPGMANALSGDRNAYSVQINTNQPIVSRNLPREYPELPEDALYVEGHQGQILTIIPSAKVVIVRLGTENGWPIDEATLFRAVHHYLVDRGIPAWTMPPQGAQSFPVVQKASLKTSHQDILKYLRLPKLIRALGAKELCSCVFVAHRSVDTCKKDLLKLLPVNPFYFVSKKSNRVHTTFLIEGVTTAEFVSDRLGCRIVP